MTVVQTIPKYNKYCSFSKKNRIYLLIIKWEEYIKYSTSLTRNPLASLLHYQSEFKNPPPTFSRRKRFSEIYILKKNEL